MRRSETRKPRPIWTLWGAVLIPAALVVLFELAKSRPALLAAWVGPYLGSAVTCEMSAVGGIIIIGIGLNMLGLPKQKLRVGNMLPAIFLPILYVPLSGMLAGVLS